MFVKQFFFIVLFSYLFTLYLIPEKKRMTEKHKNQKLFNIKQTSSHLIYILIMCHIIILSQNNTHTHSTPSSLSFHVFTYMYYTVQANSLNNRGVFFTQNDDFRTNKNFWMEIFNTSKSILLKIWRKNHHIVQKNTHRTSTAYSTYILWFILLKQKWNI